MPRCDFSPDVDWRALQLHQLGLPTRIANALDRSFRQGSTPLTGADIQGLSDDELLGARNMGRASVERLRARLALLESAPRDASRPTCDATWLVRAWTWRQTVGACDAHLADAVRHTISQKNVTVHNAVVQPYENWNDR